ncbi:putative laccase-11 [Drosophila subobscura]|uniref:putative laccase-11 n=1 Tax=Drosophila subobscura TaxID=7241 RepID=UPI00155AB4DE|nr:putative laccase-11 [Drosophila subobscura]
MCVRESKSFPRIWIIFLVLGLAQALTQADTQGTADRQELLFSTAEETLFSTDKAKFDWPWFGNKTTKGTPAGLILKNDYSQMDISSFSDFERHPCRRVCQQGQTQSCYYQLVVHNYQRLGPECQRCQFDERACAAEHCIYGDGVASPVMAVNRKIPGPAIELCENDTVVVDVLNYLGEPTTMHWHGLNMVDTPQMDGAAFVTQYPVQPGEVQRYEFKADRGGSLWYHSHMGWQRGFGVAGHLIIRKTRQANQHAHLYDYDLVEHALMVQDIFYDHELQTVRNILINGKGRNHLNQLPDNDNRHRYERLRVTPGYRYRMRVLLNGIANCPVEFSIEQHKLLIISTDGNDIEPVLADGFFLTSAERFDFVLNANQLSKSYWISVRGYEQCDGRKLYQGAVLSYRGATRTELPQGNILGSTQSRTLDADNLLKPTYSSQQSRALSAAPVLVNDYRIMPTIAAGPEAFLRLATAEKDNNVGTVALRSLQPVPWPRNTRFRTYYSSFSLRRAPNGELLFQIDEISYIPPDISLLQGRNLFEDDGYFCNRSSLVAQGRNCQQDVCECLNVIRMPAYRPIEMVVANYMTNTHPYHIHGNSFRLVGQGVVGNIDDLRNIQYLDRQGRLPRLPDHYHAVLKDSVQIPGLGFIIVRFISDNPGFWLYHCHVEAHAVQGMMAVLKIGEDYQMKQVPARVRC